MHRLHLSINLFYFFRFRRFGWDTVTALSQNEEIYSLAVNDLVTELEQANITCAATITFAETDFKEQLKLLSVSRFTIHIIIYERINISTKPIYQLIYGKLFTEKKSQPLMCASYISEIPT